MEFRDTATSLLTVTFTVSANYTNVLLTERFMVGRQITEALAAVKSTGASAGIGAVALHLWKGVEIKRHPTMTPHLTS